MRINEEDRLYLTDMTDEALNDILHKFYEKLGIKTGDISIGRAMKWLALSNELIDLMLEMAEDNMSSKEEV